MMEISKLTITQLDKQISECKKCQLYKTRTQAVPGYGDTNAKLMILGEAPGKSEDQQGLPFIGRSGKLLTTMLETNGITRDEIYITNTVKCRPPENRNPFALELSTCKALWLEKQIKLIKPKLIVLLGKVPMTQMLNEKGALKNFHGQIREHDGNRFFITYHPAAALRSPIMRAMMEEDFIKLGKIKMSL
jgi:uracil-DNA glycosylase